jgi:exonuclease III
MKNVVTFETARALKEAGFPQPDPEYLQVWYEEFNPFVEGWSREDSRHIIGIGRFEIWHEDFDMSEYYFAPTATDILRELPETSLISRIENDFQCRVMSPDFRQRCEYARRDTNPAQACAAAYLEINKTRQS